ncbi:MAG: hypothetical protein QOJ27_2120 [Sphingomonadales bacterium]|nr:hypothetical protein [Sphingomonadales bacterium]
MLALLLAAAAPAAQAPTIGTVRMHLFLEETGKLSPNIAPPAEFTGWNTIIGEGSAPEAANDLLVVVEVRNGGGEANLTQPLIVVARGPKGKLLGQRRYTNLLSSGEGRVWKGLWLGDVGCAGHIEVTATIGRSTRKSAIDLDCGE